MLAQRRNVLKNRFYRKFEDWIFVFCEQKLRIVTFTLTLNFIFIFTAIVFEVTNNMWCFSFVQVLQKGSKSIRYRISTVSK